MDSIILESNNLNNMIIFVFFFNIELKNQKIFKKDDWASSLQHFCRDIECFEYLMDFFKNISQNVIFLPSFFRTDSNWWKKAQITLNSFAIHILFMLHYQYCSKISFNYSAFIKSKKFDNPANTVDYQKLTSLQILQL